MDEILGSAQGQQEGGVSPVLVTGCLRVGRQHPENVNGVAQESTAVQVPLSLVHSPVNWHHWMPRLA